MEKFSTLKYGRCYVAGSCDFRASKNRVRKVSRKCPGRSGLGPGRSGLGPEGRGSESRHPDSLPPKTGPRATGRDIQILSAGSDHEESDDRRIRNLVQAMGLAGLLALALAFALLASRPVTERKPQYTSDVGVQP